MFEQKKLIEKWVNKSFILPIFSEYKLEVGESHFKILEATPNCCRINISHFNQVDSEYFGYNYHQALDQYREELDSQGLLIGCMGAHYNFYVKRIMIRKSFGLEGVLITKDKPTYEQGLPTVETFSYSDDIESIVTLKKQRLFHFKQAER